MPIFSGRIKRPKYSLTLVHGASANTVSTTDTLNGILREAIITTPAAVDGAATVTLNLIDVDNVTVYSKTGIAVNTTSVNLLTNDLRVPLSGSYTVQIVFSANQTTADRTISVALLIES